MDVPRLVCVSSIEMNGEKTACGDSFSFLNNEFLKNPYCISKWEAEKALNAVSVKTGLEAVIIRPSLVYGAGVKGNFFSMLGWLSRRVSIPPGGIQNQRSLVGIDNLVDLIVTCMARPAATNQTFLVSDDEDLSATEFVRQLGANMGKPARLLPVSASLLGLVAKLVGKQDIAERLLGSLQINISKTKEILEWTPPVSVNDGFRKTAVWHLDQ